MCTTIRIAMPEDAGLVVDNLAEAANWLGQTGRPMWRGNELDPERIAADVGVGLFAIAECSGEAAGTVKFQLEDSLFWPDAPEQDAAYVHRLAVRRRFAGGNVSGEILRWASDRARSLGRHYLRLDCEASRTPLRAVYERFGFRHHSDRQVGSYLVSRYELNVLGTRI